MLLFTELNRRNVFRIAVAYLASAWLLTKVLGAVFPLFGLPEWGIRFLVVLLSLGIGPAMFFTGCTNLPLKVSQTGNVL